MDAVIEVVKQVPALAVLGFIVIAFLKHLAQRDEAHAVSDEKRDEQMQICMDRCNNAIDRNTEMLGQVAKVVERANGVRT